MINQHSQIADMIRTIKDSIEHERMLLIADAKRNGVNIVHVFNRDNPKGGMTIAFRKCMPGHTTTNMVDVAVATCSSEDTFDKKIGTMLALSKWFGSETIAMPLSSGRADEDLNGRVKFVFAQMWLSLGDF